MRQPFALCCTLFLSGCVASDPQNGREDSPMFVTAMELRHAALKAAQRWESEARLNVVLTLENKVPEPNP